MEEFAEYILNEEDLIAKEEIIYFLAPKLGINFDKATIFKTEIGSILFNSKVIPLLINKSPILGSTLHDIVSFKEILIALLIICSISFNFLDNIISIASIMSL